MLIFRSDFIVYIFVCLKFFFFKLGVGGFNPVPFRA
jgi:hypothetical protein